VIDPITAYLGDTDSHKNADVRGLLAPLGELASRHNVAIIGISHLSKAAGAKALMRVSGSLAFVAAARAAYLVATDPNDPTRRLFLPMKNNLGPDATGLAFRIEGATVASAAGLLSTSRVAWDSEVVEMTADTAMEGDTTQRSTSALDDAEDWLSDALSDGPMPAIELSELANSEGISQKTLQRARKKLGIKPAKLGMKEGWVWSLPSKMAKAAEDDHQNNVATFGSLGHLRGSDEVEVEL
jgi:putative DNA primase/helicase